MVNYKKYIQSKTRQKKREEVFSWWWKQCNRCWSENDIHVHHKNYDTLWSENPIFDLEPLCKDCHREEHSFTTIKEIEYDIKIMANNTKYVFTKQVAKEIRRKIRNKIWLRLYKYLILLYDATNESTNLIDFDSFQKIADISDDTLNRIRPELRRAWIIKRLKIKWARWRYLNPLVLHWWNNEKIKFLYKHFREKSLQEYA